MPHFGLSQREFASRNEAAKMNWRRGFFRIWLLLSAAWIMGWCCYILIYGIQGGYRTLNELLSLPVLLFGPPVALLLFGLVAGWAFRGFKADEADEAGKR